MRPTLARGSHHPALWSLHRAGPRVAAEAPASPQPPVSAPSAIQDEFVGARAALYSPGVTPTQWTKRFVKWL